MDNETQTGLVVYPYDVSRKEAETQTRIRQKREFNSSDRQTRYLTMALKLARIGGFNDLLNIRRQDGSFNSNSNIIRLLNLTQTKVRSYDGVDELILLLKEAEIPPDYIINENIRARLERLQTIKPPPPQPPHITWPDPPHTPPPPPPPPPGPPGPPRGDEPWPGDEPPPGGEEEMSDSMPSLEGDEQQPIQTSVKSIQTQPNETRDTSIQTQWSPILENIDEEDETGADPDIPDLASGPSWTMSDRKYAKPIKNKYSSNNPNLLENDMPLKERIENFQPRKRKNLESNGNNAKIHKDESFLKSFQQRKRGNSTTDELADNTSTHTNWEIPFDQNE